MRRYQLIFEFEFDSDNEPDYLESELGEHLEETVRKFGEAVQNITGIGIWVDVKED